MICCKLHPDAGTLIRLKGPHVGAYCKQCGKWLKWITIDEVDECVDPTLDAELDVERIRKSYGKDWKGKVAGMTVRCGVRYWLTSNEPGELTIEQYKHAKETYKR